VTVDWTMLFRPSVPLLELVVRGSFVYLALLAFLAVARNREAGVLSTNNMLVLVLMAAATHHALVGESTSITDGLVVVATILSWSYVLDWLSYRVPVVGAWLRPKPRLLIDRGRLVRENLRREAVTKEELEAQLRLRGHDSLAAVKRAYLEADGQLSVIPFEQDEQQPPRRRSPSA
jgi:uncharacterized membrane protein YcaP (DUF421 family)